MRLRATIWPRVPALLLAALTGCASPTEFPQASSTDSLPGLEFLVAGRTSKNEIADRLGYPSAVFEQGRVWSFVLRKRSKDLQVRPEGSTGGSLGFRVGKEWPLWTDGYRWNLVVSFNEAGIVDRSGLLLVK